VQFIQPPWCLHTPQQGSEVRLPMKQTLLPHMGKSGYRDLWLPWVPYYDGGVSYSSHLQSFTINVAEKRDM